MIVIEKFTKIGIRRSNAIQVAWIPYDLKLRIAIPRKIGNLKFFRDTHKPTRIEIREQDVI